MTVHPFLRRLLRSTTERLEAAGSDQREPSRAEVIEGLRRWKAKGAPLEGEHYEACLRAFRRLEEAPCLRRHRAWWPAERDRLLVLRVLDRLGVTVELELWQVCEKSCGMDWGAYGEAVKRGERGWGEGFRAGDWACAASRRMGGG